MKARTLPTYLIPVVGLLMLVGVFSSNALADCEPPPGVTPPAEPSVTAQQVEDGSASLMDFTLAMRDQFSRGATTPEQVFYFGCLIRQEGSHWHSGSTYTIQLTPNGRVFIHTKDMALSGRLLNPVIYGSILSALGVPLTDLANMASPILLSPPRLSPLSCRHFRKNRMPHSMRPPLFQEYDQEYRGPPAMPPYICRPI